MPTFLLLSTIVGEGPCHHTYLSLQAHVWKAEHRGAITSDLHDVRLDGSSLPVWLICVHVLAPSSSGCGLEHGWSLQW